MWNNYSEGVDRSEADVEEMREGDCDTKDGKRRYRGGNIFSRRKDRRDDLQFDTKDYQCLSAGYQETRLNECGGALMERSNKEQTQNNTIGTNNSHHHLYRGGIRPFKCDICMKTYTLKGSLKTHIKNKHTEKESGIDYQCSHCSFQTNYKHYLKRHVKHKHADNVKDYQCLECSFQTNYKYYLKSHIKDKHADNAKDYQCLECSNQTNDKPNLRRHLNKHKGIKAFKCAICMMQFTQKIHLNIHIKNKHTDDGSSKDYQCLECSFQTNYKCNLQIHLNTHRSIKQFMCDICLKKFIQKRTLTKHIKNKHADDKSVKD